MNVRIIFLFSAPHVVFCFTVFFFASLVPHFFCCILKISFVRFCCCCWFQVTFNVSLMCQAILMNMQTLKVEKHKGQKTESAKDRFILYVWYSFTAWPKSKKEKKRKKKQPKKEEMHTSTKNTFCMNVQVLLQLTVQQCNLYYHTSAILAAALDTMTMPFRQETGPIHLSDVTSALSPLGRKVSLPLLVVWWRWQRQDTSIEGCSRA